MTSVEFTRFSMNDLQPALTIEEAFKKYAAFSRIHDFKFKDTANSFLIPAAEQWTGQTVSLYRTYHNNPATEPAGAPDGPGSYLPVGIQTGSIAIHESGDSILAPTDTYDVGPTGGEAVIVYAGNSNVGTEVVGGVPINFNPKFPKSFLYEFTTTLRDHSFAVKSDDYTNQCMKITFHEDSNGVQRWYVDKGVFLTAIDGGTPSFDLIRRLDVLDGLASDSYESGDDVNVPYYHRFRVSVRSFINGETSDHQVLYVSIWVDDHLSCSFSENFIYDNLNRDPVYETGHDVNHAFHADEDKIAWATPPGGFGGSNNVYVTQLRIANLNEVIPWSSLDPTEHPIDSIHRLIEDRYIKYFCRWNGGIYAFRPNGGLPYTPPQSGNQNGYTRSTYTFDRRQLFSHVRVAGAFQWVKQSDDSLMSLMGNRFHEINNTYAWDVETCLVEANRALIRSKEYAWRREIDSFGMILMEPEDVVDFGVPPSGLNIVDSISWSNDVGTVKVQVQARAYAFGELLG